MDILQKSPFIVPGTNIDIMVFPDHLAMYERAISGCLEFFGLIEEDELITYCLLKMADCKDESELIKFFAYMVKKALRMADLNESMSFITEEQYLSLIEYAQPTPLEDGLSIDA